jgi:NH3-dependent NAD+ synthetase
MYGLKPVPRTRRIFEGQRDFPMTNRTTIAVAVSGGVDSSTLARQNFRPLAEDFLQLAHNCNEWFGRKKRSNADRAPAAVEREWEGSGAAPGPYPPPPLFPVKL